MSTHSDGAQSPSARDWHLSALLFGGIGLLVGGVIGFVAGGWASCAPSEACEFKADLAGALGTWVGGLGTIGALIFAVRAFRSEEASRRQEERDRLVAERLRREEAELARAEVQRQRAEEADRDRQAADELERQANLITIRWQVGGTFGPPQNRHANELRAFVLNGASTTSIHHVTGESATYGSLGSKHTVRPGESLAREYRFRPFGNDGDAVPIPADEQGWLSSLAEEVTIEFEMNGQRWTRRGSEPVERLDATRDA